VTNIECNIHVTNDVTWFFFDEVNSILCLKFFDSFALFMALLFKPQKLDIILKRIQHESFFRIDYPVPTSRSPGKDIPSNVYFVFFSSTFQKNTRKHPSHFNLKFHWNIAKDQSQRNCYTVDSKGENPHSFSFRTREWMETKVHPHFLINIQNLSLSSRSSLISIKCATNDSVPKLKETF
jgi:hypothetical protein